MSVTERDRERAVALLRVAAADGLIEATEPRHQPEMVARIAQALADERERVTTKFVGLAEDLERGFYGYEHTEREIADLIRREAQESQ